MNQTNGEQPEQQKNVKKSKFPLLTLVPLLLFVALVAFLAEGLGRDPTALPSVKVGRDFPGFELQSLRDPNQVLSEKDLIGKPFLLNVWATWCPSCRVEHPMLLRLQASGVRLLGLNYKDDRSEALAYLAQYEDPFVLNVFDPNGDLALDLGVTGAPETYFVDANGVIQHRLVGVITPENWQQRYQALYQSMQGVDTQSVTANTLP